jgi:hypothetical protein
MKAKIDRWGYIRLKSLCTAEKTTNSEKIAYKQGVNIYKSYFR